MLRWLWNTLWSVGWYVVLVSGWVCWARARLRVHQGERELTRLAHALRYAHFKKE